MNRALLDEFRNRDLVRGLAQLIARLAEGRDKPLTFMEVCGTHTMAIYQFGIRSLLPPGVRLISGPGCPVCVTPVGYVDRAVAYARRPDTIVATFGDMLRVPGSSSSLMQERARGGDIRIVYSPLDAVALAEKNREKRLVFLGVGFETTAPTIAGAILTADSRGVDNFFVLASHKTIPIPMRILSADPKLGIDGYLCPAHVSAIIGAEAYRFLAKEHGVPCVVTGFEPADILQGVAMLVSQVVERRSRVENQYRRFVTQEGNSKARELVNQVFVPSDAVWRGLGIIPGSGLEIAPVFARFDAEKALPVEVEEPREPEGCLCGEVLKGKITPFDCPLFGSACTPERPVGACMVSSEGSCAAAYKYGQ
ncbi:MAG TPA: hydrogenase formation protein HypD [Geobacteraceae bacterium]|nr:hydrogenase formation protein HypD [Geobacteraceae bacterium]